MHKVFDKDCDGLIGIDNVCSTCQSVLPNPGPQSTFFMFESPVYQESLAITYSSWGDQYLWDITVPSEKVNGKYVWLRVLNENGAITTRLETMLPH